jgi:dipeptidyl aminopeptidase/acylaminoacyl peptidase
MAAYASEQKFALPQGRSHIKAVVACCPPIFLSEIHKSWVYVYLNEVPQEAPVLYREASPSSYVSTAVPTLLVHGMLDDVIPFSQSERLASALTTAGQQVKLIALKDVGHDFMERSGPAHDQALKELLLFLVTELKMQETKASNQ